MSMYVVERSTLKNAREQQHLTEGFGLKSPPVKLFGGSANFDSSVTSAIESRLSEDSIVVVVEVDASTGTVQSQPVLNDHGKDQLAAGRLSFLQNCGVLYATREDLGAHFYVVINIKTESFETKRDILKNIGYDGSLTICGASASSKITKTLDQKVDQKSGITSFDIRVTARSKEPTGGLGELASALQNVSQSPLQSVISAVGNYLKAHDHDTGTVDVIYLSLVNDLISPKLLQYSKFETRVAFAEKLLSARPALQAMIGLAAPEKAIPSIQAKGDLASRYLLAGVHNSTCTVPHLSGWGLIDSVVCQDEPGNNGTIVNLDRLLPSLDDIITNCLYASEDEVAGLCDPGKAIDRLINMGAIFLSVGGGLARWLISNQIKALKDTFPGVDVESALRTPEQALNSSLLNVIDAGRAAIAGALFPQLSSIDSLAAIYTELSNGANTHIDLASLSHPFADTEIASTTREDCSIENGRVNLNQIHGSIVGLDGLTDLSNLNYDVWLNFTGPLVIDQLVITSETLNKTLTLTAPINSSPDQNSSVSTVFPWIISACSLFKNSHFNMAKTLLDFGGSGRIAISYWTLLGRRTTTIQKFEIKDKKFFITNVFAQ